jgi:hypothetical protein
MQQSYNNKGEIMNLNALTESTKTHYQANPTIANVALNYPQGIAFDEYCLPYLKH